MKLFAQNFPAEYGRTSLGEDEIVFQKTIQELPIQQTISKYPMDRILDLERFPPMVPVQFQAKIPGMHNEDKEKGKS